MSAKKLFILFIVGLFLGNLLMLGWHWLELEREAETFLEPTMVEVDLLPKPKVVRSKQVPYQSAKVALVIDDLGVKTPQYFTLLDIPYKLNLAIIPGLKNSKTLVKELAQDDRFELLLHMPMEPFPHRGDQESQDEKMSQQYPFFINRQSSEASISSVLDAAMEQLEGWGFIKGINNHMGSYVTSSPNMMSPVLAWVNSHQLYFLDSLTTRSTVGYEMARRQHIPAFHNEIFLDGVDEPNYIKARLRKAVTKARSEGQVVAICHITKKNTLSVLKEMIPQYAEHGIKFVWLSDL